MPRDLTTVCLPEWKKRYIPEAFERTLIGLEKARKRLDGKTYLVIQFVHELDYDGYWDSILHVGSFATSDEAVARGRELATSAAIRYGVGRQPSGRKVEGDRVYELVRPLYAQRLSFTKNYGFDRIDVYVDVLEVPSGRIVDEGLFEYLGCSMEFEGWISD